MGTRSTSTTRARLVAKYVSLRSAAALIALSQACVSAIVSSSRSTRLSPSWPPSVVATRFATGMKSGDAGILSSARSRLANPVVVLLAFGRLVAVAVDHLAQLASRRCLELFAAALGRGNAVLDGLPHRVVRVGDHLARPLRCLLGSLHGLTRSELDRLGAQVVYLSATWAGRDICPRCEADQTAKDEPSNTAAAAFLIGHPSPSS